MFYNCVNLTFLNISNFDTSNVNDLTFMFKGCLNLEYINFNIINPNAITNTTKVGLKPHINRTNSKNISIFHLKIKKNSK